LDRRGNGRLIAREKFFRKSEEWIRKTLRAKGRRLKFFCWKVRAAAAAIHPPARLRRRWTLSVQTEKSCAVSWFGNRERIWVPTVVATVWILVERVFVEVAVTGDRQQTVMQVAQAAKQS
jgi:hypothetical protein